MLRVLWQAFDWELDEVPLALLKQRAEVEFVGASSLPDGAPPTR